MGSGSSTLVDTPDVERKALLIRYSTGDDVGIHRVHGGLKSYFGFDDENITLLYFDEMPAGNFLNSGQEAPTATRFKNRFTELIRGAKPGDVRFLYVDAHGSTLPKTNDSDEPGQDDEGWRFARTDEGVDAEIVYDNWISDTIRQELGPRVNLTILSASCRSGGMLDIHGSIPGVLLAACHETQINVKALKVANQLSLLDPWTWAILKEAEEASIEQRPLSYVELYTKAKDRIISAMNLEPSDDYEYIKRGRYLGPSDEPQAPTPWTGPELVGHQDPQLVYNDVYVDINDEVFYPAPLGIAFYRLPDGSAVHLFSGSQSAQITLNKSKRSIQLGSTPEDLANTWPSLLQAGFSRVDAVLTKPGSDCEACFFSGTRFITINAITGVALAEPQAIADGWTSLAEAGFRRVDAVLPNPDNDEEAYFFSGTSYALINAAEDRIVNGPKDIASEWPSLNEAGFTTVDAAFAIKGRNTYVFSGTRYVLIDLVPGTTDDRVINGPGTVSMSWPSIQQAEESDYIVEGIRNDM